MKSVSERLYFDSWNIQGKSLHVISEWLLDSSNHVEFLSLQEVGGTAALATGEEEASPGPLKEFILPDTALRSYILLGTKDLSSHLAQVVLLARESVECISDTCMGERLIGVKYLAPSSTKHTWVYSCHLPHTDSSDDAFADSLAEISVHCRDRQEDLTVFIGDFNCPFGAPRAVQLDDLFQSYGFLCLRPGTATRFGARSSSELDYAYISRKFAALVSSPDPLAQVVSPCFNSRLAIGSDHDRITLTLTLAPTRAKRARRRPKRGKCGRWSVGTDLAARVSQYSEGFGELQLTGKWEVLKAIQNTCCYRTASQKYRDSEALKALCKQRRSCADPVQRLELTRLILAERRAEKLVWLKNLEASAADGDAQAIRYLRSRSTTRSDMDGIVREHGSVQSAACKIKEHFSELFSPHIPADQRQRLNETIQE